MVQESSLINNIRVRLQEASNNVQVDHERYQGILDKISAGLSRYPREKINASSAFFDNNNTPAACSKMVERLRNDLTNGNGVFVQKWPSKE